MQRLMMGKGGCKKVKGVEKVEGSDDEDDDGGQLRRRGVEEKMYRPRVYRWRAERKR